eukprot:scaffold322803_cov17-Tisochrysis_lutea.AAC.1
MCVLSTGLSYYQAPDTPHPVVPSSAPFPKQSWNQQLLPGLWDAVGNLSQRGHPQSEPHKAGTPVCLHFQ